MNTPPQEPGNGSVYSCVRDGASGTTLRSAARGPEWCRAAAGAGRRRGSFLEPNAKRDSEPRAPSSSYGISFRCKPLKYKANQRITSFGSTGTRSAALAALRPVQALSRLVESPCRKFVLLLLELPLTLFTFSASFGCFVGSLPCDCGIHLRAFLGFLGG
jgi:hypothetical protein